jgi:hypothetical protein
MSLRLLLVLCLGVFVGATFAACCGDEEYPEARLGEWRASTPGKEMFDLRIELEDDAVVIEYGTAGDLTYRAVLDVIEVEKQR